MFGVGNTKKQILVQKIEKSHYAHIYKTNTFFISKIMSFDCDLVCLSVTYITINKITR